MKKVLIAGAIIMASFSVANAAETTEEVRAGYDCNSVALDFVNCWEDSTGCLSAQDYGDMYYNAYYRCLNW